MRPKILILAGLTSILGFVALTIFPSHQVLASTTTAVAADTETGMLSGSISYITDATASATEAIKFKALAASVTPPTATNTFSRGLPAYASSIYGGTSPSNANDNDYGSLWRSAQGTITATNPAWLTYDISSIPTAQRMYVMAAWYNTSYSYDSAVQGPHYNNIGAYTIDGSALLGGGSPPLENDASWTTLASVSANTLHSKQNYLGNLSTYNWIRIHMTASDGSSQNDDVDMVQFDLYNLAAAARLSDSWIFYGDSITAGGSISQSLPPVIHAMVTGNRWPAVENGGIPFLSSYDAANRYTGTGGYIYSFPGKYVTLNFGMNDAAGTDTTTFYNNMNTAVQNVLALGKIPVIPKINYTNDATHNANIPAFNAKIDLLYQTYPQIIKGPDFWSYFQHHTDQINPGDIHPNGTGFNTMQVMWENTLLQSAYNVNPVPAPSGSCSQSIPQGAGVDQVSVTLPATGNYSVWSRLMAKGATANSYYLQVDNNCPINVGDLNVMPSNVWRWLNYSNGNPNTTIVLNLTSGVHTLYFATREPYTSVDKILLTTDSTCIPSGTGTNCVPALTTAYINSGGSNYTGSDSKNWSTDLYFSGGTTFSTTNSISGTSDPTLYQTERSGTSFSYNFPVANGTYTVVLKFAEIYWSTVGSRVFNVSINGQQVLTNFDILSQVSAFTALDKTYTTTVTNGTLNISFAASVDQAKISAISIVKQ